MIVQTQTNNVMDRIINNLSPGEYKKLDEIRIELLAPKMFDRAWRELIATGRVEQSGNCIRFNK